MREIIFRGKLAHSEKWVQGNLIISNKDNPYIYPQDFIEQDGHHLLLDTDEAFWIIPETVGQFTGLTDKNRVKIFEGDIVTAAVYPFIDKGKLNYRAAVFWFDEYAMFGYQLNCINSKIKGISDGICETFAERNLKLEVIGNIHDNPELLGAI